MRRVCGALLAACLLVAILAQAAEALRHAESPRQEGLLQRSKREDDPESVERYPNEAMQILLHYTTTPLCSYKNVMVCKHCEAALEGVVTLARKDREYDVWCFDNGQFKMNADGGRPKWAYQGCLHQQTDGGRTLTLKPCEAYSMARQVTKIVNMIPQDPAL